MLPQEVAEVLILRGNFAALQRQNLEESVVSADEVKDLTLERCGFLCCDWRRV